jgi:hypothetical protein
MEVTASTIGKHILFLFFFASPPADGVTWKDAQITATTFATQAACMAAGEQIRTRFAGGQSTIVFECVAEGS